MVIICSEPFDHTVYGPAKLHKPNRIFACQNIGVGFSTTLHEQPIEA